MTIIAYNTLFLPWFPLIHLCLLRFHAIYHNFAFSHNTKLSNYYFHLLFHLVFSLIHYNRLTIHDFFLIILYFALSDFLSQPINYKAIILIYKIFLNISFHFPYFLLNIKISFPVLWRLLWNFVVSILRWF